MRWLCVGTWFVSVLLGALALDLQAQNLQPPKKERVLFIHSYPVGERGKQLTQGFSQSLERKYPGASISIESMNYKKLEEAFRSFRHGFLDKDRELVQEERKRLHDKILQFQPSILVLSDDEVGEVIHPLPSSYQGAVFFIGMNRQLEDLSWYQQNPNRYVGGISDNLPVQQTVEVLKKLIPLKSVALVSSKGLTSRVMIAEMQKELEKERIQLVDVIESDSWEDWKKRLKALDKQVDLIWMLIPYDVYENKQGKRGEVKLSRIGKWMQENLSTPTAGVSDVNVRVGVWFAQASDPHAIGGQLGDQVISYLDSGKRRNIGIEPRLSYDYIMNSVTAKKLNQNIPSELLETIRMVFPQAILEKKGTI